MGTTNELMVLQAQKHTILAIRSQSVNYYLLLQDIIYIESNGSYSKLHLTDNKTYLSCKILGHYEELLSSDFIRINRSNLVNRLHLRHYDHRTNQVLLTKNIQLKVSTRKQRKLSLL